MFKTKFPVFFLIYLTVSIISASTTVDTKKYIGTWDHIKDKDKNEYKGCPDKIIIKSIDKNKMEMTTVLRTVSEKYIFHKDRSHQGKNKIEYKKSEFPELDESYSMETVYNTAVLNGNLSVSLLVSNTPLNLQAVGVRVFSINKNGILVLEKIVSGYVDEKGKNVNSDKIQKVFFRHPNNHSMNSNAFSCQFKKSTLKKESK